MVIFNTFFLFGKSLICITVYKIAKDSWKKYLSIYSRENYLNTVSNCFTINVQSFLPMINRLLQSNGYTHSQNMK